MSYVVVMPKLGLTMSEGTIVNWFKNEGDKIEKGDKLFAVETDKLTNEVEAINSGILRKIIHKEGTVKVLQKVAIIAEENEDISNLLDETSIKIENNVESTEKVENVVPIKENISTTKVKASPKAKKIAQDLSIDLNLIKGTGTQNSITEKDVNEYHENLSKVKISPAAEKLAQKLDINTNKINQNDRIMKEDIKRYWNLDKLQEMANPSEKITSMSSMRKLISKRMSESQQESATVNYTTSVDTTEMNILRTKLNVSNKITYTDIIVTIMSRVLLEYPLLNCSISEDTIITRNYASIGVAVALEEGLVVPVVKFANVKGLGSISEEIKELAFKAKHNGLLPEDMSGGTFTVTNLGMFGIESFTPIINQPEVAILGVNSIIKTSVVINDELVIKPMMKLSLTADHRVVDGSIAAQFMMRVKEFIENPSLLIL